MFSHLCLFCSLIKILLILEINVETNLAILFLIIIKIFKILLNISFVVFFIVYAFKAAESFVRGNTAFSMNQIDKNAI